MKSRKVDCTSRWFPCSRTVARNYAELQDSQNMSELIRLAQKIFGVAFFDSPPVFSSTGACVLATKVVGNVLLVSFNNMRTQGIESPMKPMVSLGENVSGVLRNNLDARKAIGKRARAFCCGHEFDRRAQGLERIPQIGSYVCPIFLEGSRCNEAAIRPITRGEETPPYSCARKQGHARKYKKFLQRGSAQFTAS